MNHDFGILPFRSNHLWGGWFGWMFIANELGNFWFKQHILEEEKTNQDLLLWRCVGGWKGFSTKYIYIYIYGYNFWFSKGTFGYRREGTLAVVPKILPPYGPIQPLYNSYMGGICWYISQVLCRGYATFPFEIWHVFLKVSSRGWCWKSSALWEGASGAKNLGGQICGLRYKLGSW